MNNIRLTLYPYGYDDSIWDIEFWIDGSRAYCLVAWRDMPGWFCIGVKI